MHDDIKFISLPTTLQLKQTGELSETDELRYQHARWVVFQAQRRAAVIAAKVMRPDDYRHHNAERRHAVQEANGRFEKAMLDVFSETCTKGL